MPARCASTCPRCGTEADPPWPGRLLYEHTVLFAAALEKLGFRFTAVSGRVQLGADSTSVRRRTPC
ncbi:hypothetical protein [Streptomyces sp. KL116D]|uniref:hypothetical protein n=1 Tax=Streptomyces sp. KL116D TaxID=3045152 RepID=UPI00355721B6